MRRPIAVDNWLPAMLLAALLLLAFAYGVATTGSLYWPADSDLARDSAQAMTVYDGDLLGDPQYVGEMLWYNPLTPSLVALIAKVSHLPLPLIYTRAGAYLNLLRQDFKKAIFCRNSDCFPVEKLTGCFFNIQ